MSNIDMKALVNLLRGEVEDDLFVTKPGMAVIQESRTPMELEHLFTALGVDWNGSSSYKQAAEISSRLTYMAFDPEKQVHDALKRDDYLKKITNGSQHLSIYANTYVTFLIAGVSLECSMELISHREARVGRLTSSATKAMTRTLYRVHGAEDQRARQKRAIRLYLNELRNPEMSRTQYAAFTLEDTEAENKNNFASKATALTYTMNLKDFHTLFIGRMPVRGNEYEVREVCGQMCRVLHEKYDLVIRHPDEYAGMGNGSKYGIGDV